LQKYINIEPKSKSVENVISICENFVTNEPISVLEEESLQPSHGENSVPLDNESIAMKVSLSKDELLKKDDNFDSKNLTNDPATWPKNMSTSVRDYLVQKGPPQITLKNFPKNEKGTHFSTMHCKRKLPNGEIMDRPWLIYSETADAIFCFCCLIFALEKTGALATTGFNNWSNTSTRLSDHEKSKVHLESTLKCFDLRKNLNAATTIDASHQKRIKEEEKRWQQVLERIAAVILFLAERNLAFRGSKEYLNNPRNGNFLGFIELLANFDPVMQEHLRRISNNEIHDHYLGKNIQNEFIDILGKTVRKNIIDRIKLVKYFSVILDCTPDISHKEQMTLIIRYVAQKDNNSQYEINEQFIKFLQVSSSTGENLLITLKKELENLGLDINDVRGQGYDNGPNMQGKYKGVQALFLNEYPRAFNVPCACHNYNLVLGDAANKSCTEATSFFGTLQRIYVMFSASTQRWEKFRNHVTGLSVKPLSETRWECRIDSVKAIRYQVGSVYDALLEVHETADEPLVKSEAESLANHLKDYKFLVAIILWYEILFQVNFVSKELQSKESDISTGLSFFEKLLKWLKEFRISGFNSILVDARQLAEEMEIEPEFKEKRLIKRKKQFSYESYDEPHLNPQKKFEVDCFNQIVDRAIQSLQPRFEKLKNVTELFKFLYDFKDMPKEILKKHAADLELALTDTKIVSEGDNQTMKKLSDLEGYMLAEEMELLKPIISSSYFGKPLELLRFISEKDRSSVFPNYSIALRIFLTIPVTVASGERSFSKLKIIKNYLRSAMSQDRLNELAILSIENLEARELDLKDVIKCFAEKKARKM